MSWLSNEGLDKIVELQKKNPQMILCGSVALIVASILDERPVADVDFVLHRDYMDKIKLGSSIRPDDPYADAKEDGYTSYHSNSYVNGKRSEVNLLVYEDEDAYITIQTVEFKGRIFTIQKLDDILKWKTKYNRSKDIRDLENIALKTIEQVFLKER